VTQDQNRWREKYRGALHQQEQLEKTLAAQQAILHRAVSALSIAAEGQDSELDQRLSALRVSLKGNDVGGFDRMIKSLSRITEEADQRRQKQWGGINKHLSRLASQLQSMDVSHEIKPAVKAFKKRIPKGELLPPTLQRLLEEYTELQKQALTTKTDNKTSIISKLFGSTTEKVNKEKPPKDPIYQLENTEHDASDTDVSDTNPVEADSADWELVDESDAISSTPTMINTELMTDKAPRHRERHTPEAVHTRPIHEPAFSRISDRVTIILEELLDHFPIVPCVEQKAVKARERIDRGLNWYELAPTLEDIRDFVIQSYIGADDDYRDYLSHVYSELSNITSHLGLAIESEQQQRTASSALCGNVNNSVNKLQQALAEHEEINHLKSAVKSQVQTIQGALQQFSHATEQGSLSIQLSALIEKVKAMEEQDAGIRQQLETEKKKAITDKLTGLPNREAYGERVHDEMLRWQRYQRPLTLAVVDIDFFKKVNDNYGHQTGDKVLTVVAQSVAKRLREVDFIGRFGGEEFVLLLPETSAENALGMLNQIRERLAKTPLRYKEQKIAVTISIGIAEFTDGDNAETVFARADKALYDAKENGRNQCCIGE